MKTKKPKRMFVLLEIETTMTAKEVHAAFRDEMVKADAGVIQVHVNVAQSRPQVQA